MRTKQIILTLLCLSLFATAGQLDITRAQEPPQMQQDRERHERLLRFYWDGGRGGYWDGGGKGPGANARTQVLFRDPEFRAALGVSDKYYQEMLASGRNDSGHISELPGFKEAEQEYGDALEAMTGNRHPIGLSALPGTDEATIKRFQDAADRVTSMHREWGARAQEREDAAFENAITPELRQKIQEAHLAALGEMPMISPNAFEVLNLTDAQRQQMNRIKKELEPEFEKHLEIYANNTSMLLARIEAGISQMDPQEDLATFMRNLKAEPEYKRLLIESYTSGKSLAALFRTRMLDILDDGQRKRLQELIDNPPPHARYLIQRLRKEHWAKHEEDNKGKRADSEKDVWTPGPDSWKPGDPLPDWFRQEENTGRGFPRKEK